MAGLRRHGHVVAVAPWTSAQRQEHSNKGQSLFSGRRHRSRERVYNSPTPAEERRRGHSWFAPENRQESFDSSFGGRSRRARDGDDDELDLHGYTMGTHEPRMRPIRTNAHSHTEAREFGTPVDCQHRSTTADAPSGGGSAGSNPVGGTTLKGLYLLASKPSWVASDHDHLCLGPRSGRISTRLPQLVHRRAQIPIQCGNRRSTAELAALAEDLQPRCRLSRGPPFPREGPVPLIGQILTVGNSGFGAIGSAAWKGAGVSRLSCLFGVGCAVMVS